MGLLEREAELATLRQLWTGARTGDGALVLIAGDPGDGKTALAQAFAADVGGSTTEAVLWGVCTPLGTPPPLEPLREVAQGMSPAIADLVADDAPVYQVLPALLTELTATPHVLVLDDLQWADDATIDLLRLLVRRVHTTRSLVVGTHREEEIGLDHPMRGLIGDVARSPAGHQLRVRPLSRAAVATLVAESGRDPDEVLSLTAGNPFFVQEIAAATGETLPATVRDAVLARTVGLPPTAHDVLALLACAPEAVPDVVLPVLGVDLPTLRLLNQTGLLERDLRGLRFRHELCRLAIAGVIPPGGEVALHARVLDALEQSGHADPAILTHHALGAGDAERVMRYAPEAGRRAAAAGAHTQATAFYEAALAQPLRLEGSRRADLLEALAEELYVVDRLPEAITACREAIALREAQGDLLGAGSAHRNLSLFEWYNANREGAERHAATAVKVLESIRHPVELGQAYATEVYLAIQGCDLPRADHYLALGENAVRPSDDPGVQLRLEILRTVRAILTGDAGERSRLLDLGAAGFKLELDELGSSAYSNLVYLDVEQRRFAEAAELLTMSVPLTVERDLPICHVWQQGTKGRLSMLRGDWDAALRDVDAVLESRGAPIGRIWAELARGLIELRRGVGEPSRHLDAAWVLATQAGDPLRLLAAAAALAERAWLTGREDPRARTVLEQVGTVRAGIEWSLGDLATWLRRAGRAIPDHLPVAEPYRRLLSGDAVGAAAFWERIGEPYEQAMALVDSGVDGDAFRALDLLDALGAAGVAAKVRRELRERGVANVPVGPRAATRANPAGLTGRQLEVLALMAEGLSNAELANRLFISPKTVDHHISAILTKLQANSRTEAAHIARNSGIFG